MDLDTGLPICCGREDLALPGGDGGIPLDQLGRDAAEGLNPEGEWGDIEEHDVLCLSREDCALDCCPECNTLIGIDPLVRFLVEDLLDRLLDEGDAG